VNNDRSNRVGASDADDLLSVAADKAFHNWFTKYEFYALGVEPLTLQRGSRSLTLGHNALIRAKGYSQRWMAETSYSTAKRSAGIDSSVKSSSCSPSRT